MTTSNNRPDYINSAAERLHVDPQVLWEVLRAEQREGNVVLRGIDDTTPAAVLAFSFLSQFCAGKGPITDTPIAMRNGLQGLGQRYELRDIPKDQVGRRPKIDGFTEALFDWINWLRADNDAPKRMRDNLPQLQLLFTQVSPRRALFDEINSFQEWLLSDLTLTERQAFELLAHDYGLIRAQVRENRAWSRDLARVEAYLFGSAQVAAETRTINIETKKTLSKQIAPAIHEAGVKEGERRLKDSLSSVLGAAPTTDSTDSDPSRDRRGGSR